MFREARLLYIWERLEEELGMLRHTVDIASSSGVVFMISTDDWPWH